MPIGFQLGRSCRSASRFSLSCLHPHSFVCRSFPAMPSPDVVASALLLPTSVLSLALSLHNWRVHRSTPVKDVLLALLAILAAVAGGTALSAACGQPLKVVARVFTILLQTTRKSSCSHFPPGTSVMLYSVSGVSVYALSPSSQNSAFPPPFLGFFLSLASLLVGCGMLFRPPRLYHHLMISCQNSSLL